MLRCAIAMTLTLFVSLTSMWATDYINVQKTSYSKADSWIKIDVEGEIRRIKINSSTIIWDDTGKKVSTANTSSVLNVTKRVTVKTIPDPNNSSMEVATEIWSNPNPNAKPSDASKSSSSTAKKGRAGSPSRNVEKLDLHPDPNYNGKVADVAVPGHLLRWFPTAKVGDFVERSTGPNGWDRYEVVAIEGNAVILSTVVQIETSKTELRVRMKLAADQRSVAGKNAKPPTGKAAGTETITVAGQTLKCVVYKEGKSTTWYSADVPLDNMVKKETVNVHQMLMDFGKGN